MKRDTSPRMQSMLRSLTALAIVIVFISWPAINRVQASDGDLDFTFGNGGKVLTDFSLDDDFAYDLAIQADGKVVVVGTRDHGFNKFAVVRYNVNGTLDTTFGEGGRVTTTPADIAYAVAIQPDGKIIAAGTNHTLGFFLARYKSDGSLDPSFGDGGKAFGFYTETGYIAFDVLIQPDGKIVAAGQSQDSHFCLVRYNSDGTYDASFGIGGRVVTAMSGAYDHAWGVSLQGDGRIIAVGEAYNGNNNVDFAVARYNADGSLDSSFGNGGKLLTTITRLDEYAFEAVVQPDGKIVVGGGAYNTLNIALVRYNPDGSLDPSFGTGGIVVTGSATLGYFGFGTALQRDGRIVVVGYVRDSNWRSSLAVIRYVPNGTLDPTFGIGGVVIPGFDTESQGWAVGITPEGKIVAAGWAGTETTQTDFAVVRLNGDVIFDLCIRDDSSSNLLQINTTTGEYQFTNCSGFTVSGTGTIIKKGSSITLQHNAGDRRVTAKIDLSVNKAAASIQMLSQGTTFSITDRNTANNTCACR